MPWSQLTPTRRPLESVGNYHIFSSLIPLQLKDARFYNSLSRKRTTSTLKRDTSFRCILTFRFGRALRGRSWNFTLKPRNYVNPQFLCLFKLFSLLKEITCSFTEKFKVIWNAPPSSFIAPSTSGFDANSQIPFSLSPVSRAPASPVRYPLHPVSSQDRGFGGGLSS